MEGSRGDQQRVRSTPTRVRDVVTEAELANQRARLYSRARVFIAGKYLGNADPAVTFEAVAAVLGELLIAADKEAQRARHLLGQVVQDRTRPRSPRGRHRKHSAG